MPKRERQPNPIVRFPSTLTVRRTTWSVLTLQGSSSQLSKIILWGQPRLQNHRILSRGAIAPKSSPTQVHKTSRAQFPVRRACSRKLNHLVSWWAIASTKTILEMRKRANSQNCLSKLLTSPGEENQPAELPPRTKYPTQEDWTTAFYPPISASSRMVCRVTWQAMALPTLMVQESSASKPVEVTDHHLKMDHQDPAQIDKLLSRAVELLPASKTATTLSSTPARSNNSGTSNS